MQPVLILSLFSFLLGPVGMQAKPAKISVHGHRGARAVLPENTLPAYKLALDAGVDVLEMDMAVTKDGVIVMSHDPHISPAICKYKDGRKVEGDILIHSLTLAEVKAFDCGSLQNPKFPRQVPQRAEIPTLAEVFDLVKNDPSPRAKSVMFNIETKIDPKKPDETVDPETFVALFLKEVRSRKLVNRVILQSFDYRTLKIAREMEPKMLISALSEDPREDLVKTAQELKADFISPYFYFVNADLVTKLHNLGTKLAPWTVNAPGDWDKMMKLGVDAIITDDPQGLIDYIKGK